MKLEFKELEIELGLDGLIQVEAFRGLMTMHSFP